MGLDILTFRHGKNNLTSNINVWPCYVINMPIKQLATTYKPRDAGNNATEKSVPVSRFECVSGLSLK